RARRLQAAHAGRLELELRRKPREQLHLFAGHRASAEEPADDLQGLERPRFIDDAVRELHFVAGAERHGGGSVHARAARAPPASERTQATAKRSASRASLPPLAPPRGGFKPSREPASSAMKLCSV